MKTLLNYLKSADNGRLIVLALLNMIFISDFSLYALFKTDNTLYYLPLFLSTAGAIYAGIHIPDPKASSDHSTHYHLLIVSEQNQPTDHSEDHIGRRW